MSESTIPFSEESQPLQERGGNRSQRPESAAFKEFMQQQWSTPSASLPGTGPAAAHAANRRRALSEEFPGERLIIPAGPLKVRSNDTDYRFRPHSAFAHLTGLGVDQEPDAVLVMEPVEPGTGELGGNHSATLYFKQLAGHESPEFYTDARYGEFWIGPRDTHAQVQALLDLPVKGVQELEHALTSAVEGQSEGLPIRLVRESDPHVDAVVDTARIDADIDLERSDAADAQLSEAVSQLRMLKDDYEREELQRAVDATIKGFEDVVRVLPETLGHPRGERVIEGTFFTRARVEGNDLGYETISAAGPHATILHWIRNDGGVRDGDLVLLDGGVEVESLYTADVTRTLPANGSFTPLQRQVYQAVLDAADAGFAAALPGNKFRDVHAAAVRVLAERLAEWGLLPVSLEEALSEDGQQHRRWMPHGTSHHLGLDVHDCAAAKRELYIDGTIEAGMSFTIEPGLYFKEDDLSVPEQYRGIGVRIEDDIFITPEGPLNLSVALPREPDAVEAWMKKIQGTSRVL